MREEERILLDLVGLGLGLFFVIGAVRLALWGTRYGLGPGQKGSGDSPR